jgi:hypothetical protein
MEPGVLAATNWPHYVETRWSWWPDHNHIANAYGATSEE